MPETPLAGWRSTIPAIVPTAVVRNHSGVRRAAHGTAVTEASSTATTTTHRPHHVLRGHTAFVQHVAFSPRGAYVATASGDGTVALWRVDDGAAIHTLRGHESAVYHVAFSGDGALLATASSDGTARVWSVEHGAPIGTLSEHSGPVTHVVFSPTDATLLATASMDGLVNLWRVCRHWNEDVRQPDPPHHGHRDHGEAGWTSDDRRSHGADMDSRSGYQGDEERRLQQRSHGRRGPVRNVASLQGHQKMVHHAAFSPCGAYVATASADATAMLWNVRNGACVSVLRGHEKSIYYIAFSPNGAYLATASADNTAKLWRVASGRGDLMATLGGHRDEVYHVAIAIPNDNEGCSSEAEVVGQSSTTASILLVATASGDATANVWRVETGDIIFAATNSSDRGGIVGRAASRPQLLRSLRHADHAVLQVAFVSPPWNQSQTSIGGGEGNASGRSATTMRQPYLVTTSDGPDVLLWTVAAMDGVVESPVGAAVAKLEGHAAAVNGVAVCPFLVDDGNAHSSSLLCIIATASNDGTAVVWQVPPPIVAT